MSCSGEKVEEGIDFMGRERKIERVLYLLQLSAKNLEDTARSIATLYPEDPEAIKHAREAEGAASMLDQWSDMIAQKEVPPADAEHRGHAFNIQR